MLNRQQHLLLLLLLLPAALARDLPGIPAPNYNCPEANGRFADAEQCDKYYVCNKGVATEVLCPEGMLFDDSIANREKCVLPYNVDCGAREFVQPRTPDIDPRCEKANGIFDFPEPTVCDKYIQCDNGVAFEFPCAAPLLFDIAIGGCARSEQLSEIAKRCDEKNEYLEVDGFTCPGGDAVGPQNLLQQHPVYPHPGDCQYYFTCYFGKEPNKFGCSSGQVFDAVLQQCQTPEKVPDCACWYECGENSGCPDDCLPDCTCPGK